MINILSLRIELKASNNMETITKIPGLQHISEDIFKLLDGNSLMNCRVTNSSWKNVLEQSIFWLQKLRMEGWKALAENIGDQKITEYFVRYIVELVIHPSSDFNLNYRMDLARGTYTEEFNGRILYKMKEYRPLSDIKSMWIAVLLELKNDHQSKEFVLILIKIYNNRSKLLALAVVVPLMINKYPDLVKSILENENPRSKVNCFFMTRKLKVFTIYSKNVTSIHLAALCGLIGVVEKLSKKYDDPMVEYLTEFTKATLAPGINGWTPIHYAAINGNLETVKFLVGHTKTPNAPDDKGITPISLARSSGNVEVQKFLENYSK